MLQIINQLRLSRTDSDEISVIEAKQGDNQGDICQIEIYDNQDIVDLSQFDDILFTANKPDMSSVLFRLSDKKNLIKNGNILSLTFTSALLSMHGTVECEISFYKNDIIKSTYNFNIYVFKSPSSFDVMNESDINTIKDSVKEIVKIEQNVNESVKQAKQSEDNSKISEKNAKTSETNALNSANIAAIKADNAKVSESNAKLAETNASDSAIFSKSYAVGDTGIREDEDTDNAKYYYNNTKLINTNVTEIQKNVKADTDAAKASADNAKASETASKNSELNTKQSELNAATSEANALNSEIKAKLSEDNAKVSENNSKFSETNSKSYMDSTKEFMDNTETYMNSAGDSKNKAKESENNAKLSETNSFDNATLSKSYAVGDTGTRLSEDTDNAKYYAEYARTIKDQIDNKLKLTEFDVNEDGELIYTDGSSTSWQIDDNGNLNWEVN